MILYALSSMDRAEILCTKPRDEKRVGLGGEREKERRALCQWRFCY